MESVASELSALELVAERGGGEKKKGKKKKGEDPREKARQGSVTLSLEKGAAEAFPQTL